MKYTENTKIQHGDELPSWILKTKHNFHSFSARLTKFYMFSSVFDLRQFMLYSVNLKIEHGGRPPS